VYELCTDKPIEAVGGVELKEAYFFLLAVKRTIL
jgi:hypothetical protein